MFIQLEAITKSYSSFSLGPISMAMEPGRILGFAGPNGAGKSTTLKIMMGLVRPDSGHVKILGKKVDRKDGSWKKDIGYVAEETVFYEGWRGSKNLDLKAQFHSSWSLERADYLATRLKLDLRKLARDLSRGNRVKLALVSAMAYQPRLLILDEPTSGLDPITRNEVLELLLEYVSTEECSVLFSTHIIPDMERIADEVLLIKDGKIIRTGAPADITESWRKIRFKFPYDEIDLPGVVSHKVEGQTHLVITCEHALAKRQLEKNGVMIHDINRITLEEVSVYLLKGSAQ